MYYVKVAQLDNATLQSIWFHLQDDMYKLKQLHIMIGEVKHLTGGALLEQLHQLYIAQGYNSAV